MNFLECVLRNGDTPSLGEPDGAWQLPISGHLRDAIRSRADTDALILGLRPEDLTLAAQPIDTGLEAEVYAVEPLGDRTIFDLRLGGEIIKVRTPPTFDAPQGSRIWFDVNRDRVHLFDPKTDRAIL
jgi:multiple sugar transport system ATP-binding protein